MYSFIQRTEAQTQYNWVFVMKQGEYGGMKESRFLVGGFEFTPFIFKKS